MLIAGNTKQRKVMPINHDRIVRHRVNPEEMDISLTWWGHRKKWSVSVSLSKFSNSCYTIMEFSDEGKAEVHYYRVLDAIQKDAYSLHIYDNGKVNLTMNEPELER